MEKCSSQALQCVSLSGRGVLNFGNEVISGLIEEKDLFIYVNENESQCVNLNDFILTQCKLVLEFSKLAFLFFHMRIKYLYFLI